MSIISAGTSNTTTLVYTGDTTGNLVFQSNGTTEAMRITTAQNVGIGTSSPSSILHIASSSQPTFKILYAAQREYGLTVTGGATTDGLAIRDESGSAEIARFCRSGNVGIGTSSPDNNLTVEASSSGYGISVYNTNSNSVLYMAYKNISAPTAINNGSQIDLSGLYSSVTPSAFATYGRILGAKENATAENYAGYLALSTRPNGGSLTERMRIDSSGNVGIGTNSPTAKLHIEGSSQADIKLQKAGTSGVSLFSDAAGTFKIYDNAGGATRLTLDSAGNLGLGVTPSAWGSSRQVMQLGTTASINGATNEQVNVGSNFYITSGGTITYITTNYATRYAQQSGIHAWYTAPSGTAGNAITFTQAMTLDASGNLGIGTSSPDTRLDVEGTSQIRHLYTGGGSLGVLFGQYNTSGDASINNQANAALAFNTNNTERMRITSGGNVGIGTSSPGGKLTVVRGSGNSATPTSLTYANSYINIGKEDYNTTSPAFYAISFGYVGTGGTNAPAYISYLQTSTTSFTLGDLAFYTRSVTTDTTPTERMRITSGGDVGIGTSSPTVYSGYVTLDVRGSTSGGLVQVSDGTVRNTLYNSASVGYAGTQTNHAFGFVTNGTERMRITSGGDVLVAKTSATGFTGVGHELRATGQAYHTNDGGAPLVLNRLTSDGTLVSFRQDGTEEGTISVSGTTVSYNGGHLSRYAQTSAPKDESIVKGTVLSNLDEMNEYVDAEGNPVANEQLNKVKVSDVEGDVNVAGVFVNWSHDEQHNVDEINMAMTGDMIIRIAQGVVIQKGDLLMSAGDGTAKPQGDDIVRSKTIAKVTSNHVTCTYADGSYCVPCVLMAC